MRGARARLAAFAAVAVGVLAPALASACATCTGAADRNRVAFLGSTLFLSVLPLAMLIGGFVWWARGGRAWLAREFVDRDAWTPDATPPGGGGDRADTGGAGAPTRA